MGMEGTVPWKVGSAVIVRNQAGAVLLGKRDKDDRRGYWVLPGGTVRPGESLAEAARREVAEETGLDVEIGQPVSVYAINAGRIAVFSWAAEVGPPMDPVAGDDLSEVRFVPAQEVGMLPLTPTTRRVLGDAGILRRNFQGSCATEGEL